MTLAIHDYALIGDGQTAALVSRSGSIDWLCWPRFDSDACFAALLGTPENGHWRLAPENATDVSRRYRGDTLILETTFTTPTGMARLIDFMPRRPDGTSSLIRLIECLRGEVEFTFEMRVRFDYGNMKPWITRQDHEIMGVVGPDRVVLRTDVDDVNWTQEKAHRTFVVREGQHRYFTLQYGLSHKEKPARLDVRQALRDTDAFWTDWISQFDRTTDWPAAVKRSLIVLKALIHQPTGGLVAAPTLGLPEKPGKTMNWDYRYCWLRDSTFTLSSFLNCGYHEEAKSWLHWLLRAIAGMPDKIQVMYRVDGARHLDEWTVPWLDGFNGAKPVRVGNAAYGQRQLDIYGEILDSIHLAERAGIERTQWGVQVEIELINHLEAIWDQPDQGLWESRDEPQHYVYSKVMCWVAFDRFLRGRESATCRDPERREQLCSLRDKIHEQICTEGYNSRVGSFVQHYGTSRLDASVLLLPLVGFLPIDDPRITSTIAAIERHLMEDGLVRRYAAPWLGKEEGTFLACSFWLVDCMRMQGRTDEARALFERLLSLRNDVGLLSEEYHVPRQQLIGNFPQALSHLALINSALQLCGPILHRSGA